MTAFRGTTQEVTTLETVAPMELLFLPVDQSECAVYHLRLTFLLCLSLRNVMCGQMFCESGGQYQGLVASVFVVHVQGFDQLRRVLCE